MFIFDRHEAHVPGLDCSAEIIDHDPETLSFRARVTVAANDDNPEATAVLCFPPLEDTQKEASFEARMADFDKQMAALTPAFGGRTGVLRFCATAILAECFTAFEEYYCAEDLEDYTARVNPERGEALQGTDRTTKESVAEWRQLYARRLSGDDRAELRYALRTARRTLDPGGDFDPAARGHLDGLGVDYSNLVGDHDGDAPDRFAPEEPLDWSWKPMPEGVDDRRYSRRMRGGPRVGDCVRRPWSMVEGTVVGHKKHGRGFSVRVEWNVGPATSVASTQLVPVGLVDLALVH